MPEFKIKKTLVIIILSPAKSLDYKTLYPQLENTKKAFATSPIFESLSQKLVLDLQRLNVEQIKNIMAISPKLAKLNYERFCDFNQSAARQAIFAFDGDVYREIDKTKFQESDFIYLQNHVRILSGLYGLLRPLDLIKPHRLEMGTSFSKENFDYQNLYDFWNDKISLALTKTTAKSIVNLASQEYFLALHPNKISKRLINISFKDYGKKGELKTIGINSKKARGMMTNYAIHNKISDPDQLKNFTEKNYYFAEGLSNQDHWVFVR